MRNRIGRLVVTVVVGLALFGFMAGNAHAQRQIRVMPSTSTLFGTTSAVPQAYYYTNVYPYTSVYSPYYGYPTYSTVYPTYGPVYRVPGAYYNPYYVRPYVRPYRPIYNIYYVNPYATYYNPYGPY